MVTRSGVAFLAAVFSSVVASAVLPAPSRGADAADDVFFVGPPCAESASQAVAIVSVTPPPWWPFELRYYQYDPRGVDVLLGTTVTWTNDGHGHTVTANDTNPDTDRLYFHHDFPGGGLPETFSVRFCQTGYSYYHCEDHRITDMNARVTVV